MKFPFMIIILLIFIATIAVYVVNIDANYSELEESQYISSEKGNIKIKNTFYFVYEDALRSETRNITIKDSNYGKAILDEISKGSQNTYFKSIFDFNVKISSVELINETCYINFENTPEWEQLLNDSRLDLYLWSVVNSLTDNTNIKDVQILVEGVQKELSLHGFNLNAPLPKLESLNYSKKETASDTVLKFLDYMNSMRFDLAYSLITKNSMRNYDYSAFIKYANTYNDAHAGYVRGSYYTKIKVDEHLVYVKFSKEFETDGYSISYYDQWTVVLEEDSFRININSNSMNNN